MSGARLSAYALARKKIAVGDRLQIRRAPSNAMQSGVKACLFHEALREDVQIIPLWLVADACLADQIEIREYPELEGKDTQKARPSPRLSRAAPTGFCRRI